MMIGLAVISAVLVIALCAHVMRVRTHPPRQRPLEWREDWWTDFERQFRDYAERAERVRRRRARGPVRVVLAVAALPRGAARGTAGAARACAAAMGRALRAVGARRWSRRRAGRPA